MLPENFLPKLNCGGCTTCCKGDTITLQSEDDASQYETVEVNGELQLAKGKNGNCIYLKKDGCSIHDNAPVMCKALDCRKYFMMFSKWDKQKQQLRMNNPQTAAVLREGQRRLQRGG